MTFLEARKLVAQFKDGADLPFLFGLSGTPDPFTLYLKAACAKRGLAARPRFLPFNTLGQHLATGAGTEDVEVYLLLPWDLAPEADWRSGVPLHRADAAAVLDRAAHVASALRGRKNARVLYLAAPIPPLVGHVSGDLRLQRRLEALAAELGAVAVPASAFSLASYFASGCPVGGAWLGRVAEIVVEGAASATEPAKVLVTDLDDTLWAGVIAEDGSDGIGFRPEGAGYRHYVYQTLLARLRREGIVLAAVSRNDRDVVLAPLRGGRMPLGESDFVAICASYHAKSAQIRELASQLNLGLDSLVFVDDNPIELEEVHATLPQVRIVAFPDRDDALPAFLVRLTSLFGRRHVTAEDEERTRLYRRRLESMAPVAMNGADLTRFLAELRMRLVIHDRSRGDRTRAVQLINKTNQFNANGRRWTDDEVGALLDRGGRLLCATLADRTGSHGEILACAIAPGGTIEAFVMSCRVFQRRVELAFMTAMAERGILPAAVRVARTDRNTPFQQFAQDPAFGPTREGIRPFDAAAWTSRHGSVLQLFEIAWD